MKTTHTTTKIMSGTMLMVALLWLTGCYPITCDGEESFVANDGRDIDFGNAVSDMNGTVYLDMSKNGTFYCLVKDTRDSWSIQEYAVCENFKAKGRVEYAGNSVRFYENNEVNLSYEMPTLTDIAIATDTYLDDLREIRYMQYYDTNQSTFRKSHLIIAENEHIEQTYYISLKRENDDNWSIKGIYPSNAFYANQRIVPQTKVLSSSLVVPQRHNDLLYTPTVERDYNGNIYHWKGRTINEECKYFVGGMDGLVATAYSTVTHAYLGKDIVCPFLQSGDQSCFVRQSNGDIVLKTLFGEVYDSGFAWILSGKNPSNTITYYQPQADMFNYSYFFDETNRLHVLYIDPASNGGAIEYEIYDDSSQQTPSAHGTIAL